MFNTPTEQVFNAPLGTITHTNNAGLDIYTVELAGETYEVKNLVAKTKKTGKPYHLGNLVREGCSWATVVAEPTKDNKPMFSLTIKHPDLLQKLGGVKSLWSVITDGKGGFSETKDNPQQIGQPPAGHPANSTDFPGASERYDQQSNGF